MAGEALVVLDVVATEQEAEVICGLLRSAGVAGPYEVVVRAEDLEAAREVLGSSGPEQPSE